MVSKLTELALSQRLVVFALAALAVAWGVQAYKSIPIDAFPDVAPTQVLVSVKASGLPPEELEARVTAPIEIIMRGIPRLAGMRSTTRYGVALLTFEFAEGTDIYWARAQVNERLQEVRDQLPASAQTTLAPIVTPLAEMLMFTIESETLDAEQIRSLIDWTIRPSLRGLPGVADINVLGGFVRTYEIVPSPSAMAARGIATDALERAIIGNNRNDGAGRLKWGEESLLVRSDGRIESVEDVQNIIVAVRNNTIVRLIDVAEVRIGALARNGVVTANGKEETVWGLVLGLRGADAKSVVAGVKAQFTELQNRLPADAKVKVFYDRSDLITKAVWTVQKVLIEAIVLVVILLVLILGNLRAALVVSLILPVAVLITFGLMHQFGYSANIMSLGGLAIAVGLLVDCAVVVVENVEHRLSKVEHPTSSQRIQITLAATREVSTPLVSGVVIIVTVFLPLLALQGLEGRLFRPVALTIAFALIAALILSLTIVPALSAMLLRSGAHKEPWLSRKLQVLYRPLLRGSLRRPSVVFAIVIFAAILAILAFTRIGSTFMPTMDEGTTVITVRKHATISVEDAARTDMQIQRALLQRIPEIRSTIARAGADELGLDPVGLNETDIFLTLAPKSEWRQKDTQWLLSEVRAVLIGLPGISFAFAQPIDMRVQEMIIGARGDVVLKVFGDDIDKLNTLATEVAQQIRQVPGSTDVFALRNEGMKYQTVAVDRSRSGRFGLNATDVQDALRVWIDGTVVGLVLEGSIRTPITIRGEKGWRSSPMELGRLPVVKPGGGAVELAQVADIRIEDGPIQIIREQGQRYATVLANVRGRDLVGFVDEARARVTENVKLPVGYSLVWGGQFENQQRAAARLAIVVPIALVMIFMLLYLTLGSVLHSVLVFCNVPFALIGGVLALWSSGEFVSVPASVGFIALLGIAVLNGVVLVSYVDQLVERGKSATRAVYEGACRRAKPVCLTALIAALGLVPFLFATGPGAEIQRPLAIVVIGGLVSATVLTLIMLPILYVAAARLRLRASIPEARVSMHQ